MHYKHIRYLYLYIYIYHIFSTSVSFIYEYVVVQSFPLFLDLEVYLQMFLTSLSLMDRWVWEAMAFHGSMWFSETVGGLGTHA